MEEIATEAAPPPSEVEEVCEPSEVSEPKAKKRKMSEGDANEKLEDRLGGILRCAVCLDLPRAAVYQCVNGHLMCAACFTHLLADARLRDDASATCPNCRIEISKTSVTRNLAVEKAVSELPSECKFCTKAFPRHALQQHEETTCDDREYKFSQIVVCPSSSRLGRLAAALAALVAGAARRLYLLSEPPPLHLPPPTPSQGKPRAYRRVSGCRYACIGCPWRGPAHGAAAHEARCAAPARSAADVLATLAASDQRHKDTAHTLHQILDLLSYENITFNDLELKPYRTEEFLHKLYYESLRFSGFGHQWVVRAFVNRNQREPAHSAHREITYQVVCRSKVGVGGVCVWWTGVRGAHGAARLAPALRHHTFRTDDAASPPAPLPLADPTDANRLLADKAIRFRLIMFQA